MTYKIRASDFIINDYSLLTHSQTDNTCMFPPHAVVLGITQGGQWQSTLYHYPTKPSSYIESTKHRLSKKKNPL